MCAMLINLSVDHPRSRGENPRVGVEEHVRGGSSPLTRGKPRLVEVTENGQGIIPAHAGKTVWVRAMSAIVRDHPRSRGENVRAASACVASGGSSPLTRGKLRAVRAARGGCGIIPAHAGKTTTSKP